MRYADCAGREQLAETLDGGGPDAAGQKGHRAGRWLLALGVYSQQRFRAGAGWLAGPSAKPSAMRFHDHQRRVLTWDQLYRITAQAAGVEAANRSHRVGLCGRLPAG